MRRRGKRIEIKGKRGRGGWPKQRPGERGCNDVRDRRDQREFNEKIKRERRTSDKAVWCKTRRGKVGRMVRYEKGG
jgi:hypothetical protein